MQKQAAFRLGAGLTCLLTAAVAAATPPVGPAPAPQSPEFMLYMSWPVGAGGGSSKLPNFSLRVGQARLGGNSGNPAAGDPMQHRELFRVELFGREHEPALGMRFELGGRVTYDVHRGVFGLRADGWRRPSSVQVTTSGASPLEFVRSTRVDNPPPARPSFHHPGQSRVGTRSDAVSRPQGSTRDQTRIP
jgi:hypothetical protein